MAVDADTWILMRSREKYAHNSFPANKPWRPQREWLDDVHEWCSMVIYSSFRAARHRTELWASAVGTNRLRSQYITRTRSEYNYHVLTTITVALSGNWLGRISCLVYTNYKVVLIVVKSLNPYRFRGVPPGSHDAISPVSYPPPFLPFCHLPFFNLGPGYHPGKILELKMLVGEP